jgi:hypothetical protein
MTRLAAVGSKWPFNSRALERACDDVTVQLSRPFRLAFRPIARPECDLVALF